LNPAQDLRAVRWPGHCAHKKPGTGQTGTGLVRVFLPANADAFGVG
jgi:hypothetical protein